METTTEILDRLRPRFSTACGQQLPPRSYAAPAGHALIDQELCLPRSWTSDPGRRQGC